MDGTPNLNKAIVQLQAELPRVAKGETGKITGKDGKPGYTYKYADLADVTEAILPLLAKCGLAFTAMPDVQEGQFGLRYQLRHISGEEDGGFYLLPDPARTAPQQVGSAITYARRYSLCAATGVAPDGDDDDGASAQQGHESFDDALPAGATRGSAWQPPANPHTRKADRSRGPMDDDPWTTAPPDGQGPEARPGTSTPEQWRQIAIKLSDRGLTERDDKLAFCAEVTGRQVASSKELSFAEAAQVLKVAAG